MTDNERDVERRISTLESNVNNLVAELRDFKTEMRQQNQIRAEEIRDLQKRQDAAQIKHDSDMREMNKKIDDKFDKLSEQIHTMTIAAVVGFGAIAAAVGGLVFAAFK